MKIANILVQPDGMSLTFQDNGRQFTVDFTGEITSSFATNQHNTSLSLYCTHPRTGEKTSKPLNRPPGGN